VLSDSYHDGLRKLRLQISVRPEAITVAVHVLSDVVLRNISVDGVLLGNWYYLDYWAPPPEGFELEIEFEGDEPFEFRVVDRSWGLEGIPGYAGRERPPGFMAAPRQASDVVMVTKKFVIGKP
jgi:hypothetical protein